MTDRLQSSRSVSHGLAPSARKWPIGVVLVVALALALAVPLAGRAFGTAAPHNAGAANSNGPIRVNVPAQLVDGV